MRCADSGVLSLFAGNPPMPRSPAMRLIIGGILAALALTGCSSEPKGPGPGPGALAAADPEKYPDMCKVLPAQDAGKALGLPSLKTRKDLDGSCLYTGLPGCEQVPDDDCEILVQHRTRPWEDPPGGENVTGIGEKANYIGLGTVLAKIDDKRSIMVNVPLAAAPNDEEKHKKYALDMAKAIAAKL